ncbi:hypothetical protein CC2G_008637 [Coprinopsis cinerea AmutBmut pab1-1]|nr:hypothetical protein CC2G_008637 [Coprinopsis cinerea AmutBmut pab1-1]
MGGDNELTEDVFAIIAANSTWSELWSWASTCTLFREMVQMEMRRRVEDAVKENLEAFGITVDTFFNALATTDSALVGSTVLRILYRCTPYEEEHKDNFRLTVVVPAGRVDRFLRAIGLEKAEAVWMEVNSGAEPCVVSVREVCSDFIHEVSHNTSASDCFSTEDEMDRTHPIPGEEGSGRVSFPCHRLNMED